MRVSIIIPFRGSPEILEQTLQSLVRQEGIKADDYEIIVTADGLDQPAKLPESVSADRPRIIYRRIRQAGPAVARNQAVSLASSGLLLFLGSDTIADRDLLIRHLTFHEQNEGAACLGYIGLPEGQPLSNLDRFLYRGSQFHFPSHSQPVDFWHFYSSNLSLSRAVFLERGGFHSGFRGAGWEDSEFGYRFCRRYRIVYVPEARVVHHHPVTMESFLRRQVRLGEDVHIFLDLHPELDRAFKLRQYPVHRLLKTILANALFRQWLQGMLPLFEKLAYSSLVHYYFRIVRYQYFYLGYRSRIRPQPAG